MSIRIDLPKETLDQAIQIMRQPKSIRGTAKELGIPYEHLRRNLQRSGLLGQSLAPQSWSENIANKYLVMRLRQPA